MQLFIYLFIYLFEYLFDLFIYLFIYLFDLFELFDLFIYLFIYLFNYYSTTIQINLKRERGVLCIIQRFHPCITKTLVLSMFLVLCF